MPAQIQTIKAVFNGGEMSPLMDGRTDSEKYSTGCRLLENFIVRPYGGIFKRPGTRFGLADSDVTDTVRLIPFRRSTDVNFVLGFKTNAINIWSYSGGVFTHVDTLTTTYAEADIYDIHYCQLNDVMFLTHGDYVPQRITRASDGTWTIEDVPFQFAPALDPPDDAVTMTLVYDANDWVTATSYSVGDFVLYLNELYRCKTANSDVAFTAAKWDKAVYRTPWNVGQTYVAGDVVEYFGSNYFWKGVSTAATSANRPGVGADWVLISITDYRLIASSATFDADEVDSVWLLSPGSTNRLATESFGTGAGTVTSAAIFVQGSYLARTVWAAGSAPTLTALQLQESLDRINFTTIKEWRVQAATEGTISYTADAPNTGGWYRFVAIRDTGASSSASAWMTIEPAVGKLDIPFLIESYTSTTVVKGIPKLAVDSLIPNEVIGVAFPVWRKGAFSTSRGYPRTVTFHDQRLWFAGTETQPMRIWGSQTDDFYTFLTGTLDTSGIDVTLAATQANDIQWITSFKRTMVIGTTGEEWTMDSGDQDNALTPSSLRLRRWSRYGSSKHQPIIAGDGLLWLTRDNRLREFAYVFEKDGYSAPDMTLLAEHIPNRSNVMQVSYSQSPDPIVWFIHEDGTWSGFTYDRENNVTAWHRHSSGANSDAVCKSICTIYSDGLFSNETVGADTMVFLFTRSVNSGDVDTMEVIDGRTMQSAMGMRSPITREFSGTIDNSPFVFMDSYVSKSGTYSAGTGLTTFTSMNSANPAMAYGATVVFTEAVSGSPKVSLATDGSPHESSVGLTHSVTAIGDFSSALIGIPFTAYVVPPRIEIPLQDGTSQMRRWRIVRIAFRLFQSKYGAFQEKITSNQLIYSSSPYQIDYTDIEEYPYDIVSVATTHLTKTGQTLPQTTNFSYDRLVNIVLTSRHPTPFNLLACLMDIEIGEPSST